VVSVLVSDARVHVARIAEARSSILVDVDLLAGVIQPYTWGSRTFVAALQGRPTPSPTPEAELWLGAHPVGPSTILEPGGARRSLLDRIREAPERELGAEVARRFGALPFLLKVLAADEPLSLQTHPSAERAREGFARENAAGIPIDAPSRTYKDASHKPELVVALTPFEALSGFRNTADAIALLGDLAIAELAPALAKLRASPNPAGLRAFFETVMRAPPDARARMVEQTCASCTKHRGRFEAECAWALRLARRYPGDPGVVAALLLNYVRLAPGEGLFLPAGNLHAYLGGAAIEVMAASDNVLRGGLTPKHVDVEELLRVVSFEPYAPSIVRGRPAAPRELVWDTPAEEFALARVDVDGDASHAVGGPEILLCIEGEVTIRVPAKPDALAISRGQAAFVSASDVSYALSGRGALFRASVPR
jgi:mannose-6-phosphate isomerase